MKTGRKNFFRRRREGGFSLMEVMVAVGIGGIVTLGLFTLKNNFDKSMMAANVAAQADSFRKEITEQLKNRTAWSYTVANNNTFACVQNATDCKNGLSNGPWNGGTQAVFYSYSRLTNDIGACTGGSPPATCYGGFDVYNAKGSVAYPFATTTNRGFTLNGAPCTTYPSDTCPFRVVLWWVPVCPNITTVCYSPMLHVQGYVLYSPSATDTAHVVPFGNSNYGINLILPPPPGLNCVGSTNYLNSNCDLTNTNSGSSSGTCTSGTTGACSYLCTVGLWSQTSNSCVAASPCAAQTNYLGSLCDLALTAHGGSSGSCTSGSSGACSYSCSNGAWSSVSNTCQQNCAAVSNYLGNHCTLPATNGGSLGTGSCDSGWTGTCSYQCNSGTFGAPVSNLCKADCTAATNYGGTSHCDLGAKSHGQTSGTCSSGYSGACQYTCNDGAWGTPGPNSCVQITCPAQSNYLGNHCDLPLTNSGSSAGSCESGYTGACSYPCTDTGWGPPTSNTCAAVPSNCTAQANYLGAHCDLPAGNHGNSVAGSCSAGYTGACSYTCTNGVYGAASSNTCMAGCSAQTGWNGTCDLAAKSHGETSGTCTSGLTIGSCSYTCNNGSWTQNSDTCASPPPPCPGGCAAQTNYLGAHCDLACSAPLQTSGTCSSGYTGACQYTCDDDTPTWVLNSNTCGPCGGVVVGGYCYYFGGLGQSCDTVCGTHGGANAAGTLAVGSGGSDADCTTVMAALSQTGSFEGQYWTGGSMGCFADASRGGIILRHGWEATTTSASTAEWRRACACNN